MKDIDRQVLGPVSRLQRAQSSNPTRRAERFLYDIYIIICNSKSRRCVTASSDSC